MTTHKWLLPASWIYGLAVAVRNRMFDGGLLRSRRFGIPVISVGNLAVGGTGKTPHVEYLVRLLHDTHHVAVLSRGYKRKSKGFVLANPSSTAADIGDEPMQIHSKYPDITVAADADRCHGIDTLLSTPQTQSTDVVVLDDAYQHRYVAPGLSILLLEHSRLDGDLLLPAGRLREPWSQRRRADIIIVSKCPAGMSGGDYEKAARLASPYPHQKLFFSTMEYGQLQPTAKANPPATLKGSNVLLITGIANPSPLKAEVERQASTLTHLSWGDHHNFDEADISKMAHTFAAMPEPKIAVTTEKDATRLATLPLPEELRSRLYSMPITVRITNGGQEEFERTVTRYAATGNKE